MRTNVSDGGYLGTMQVQSLDDLQQQHIADRSRSAARLRLASDEVDRMVAEFAAAHGGFTRCPPAYVALSRQYSVQ